MKINFVRLQNFRNVGFANVCLGADSVWIFGENAQGKTNLLEALGLLNALRSFRTAKASAMIFHGEQEAKILLGVSRENFGDCEIEITLAGKNSVSVDGVNEKFSDFIGRFPIVAATSEDIALVRSSPETRRRQTDMFAASLDPLYLDALRRYHAALSARNALLRRAETDEFHYAAFENEMALAARKISEGRKIFLGQIAMEAREFYAELAGENGDRAKIEIRPNCDYCDPTVFAAELAANRRADIARASTSRGPHRDDFAFELDGKSAKLYASEGQQRSLVLAFRLAQFEIIKKRNSVEPVLICDDVLAELDAKRRAAFWRCASPTAQVVASATVSAPDNGGARVWKCINVYGGKFLESDGTFAQS